MLTWSHDSIRSLPAASTNRHQWLGVGAAAVTARNGFTILELLVVIAILAVIAVMTLMVFRAGAGSDRMRSAARVVQSAFLGAKDRALHARDLRGVRLIRDPSNPALVPGFVYLQPLPMLSYPAGSFRLDRLDVNPHDNVPDSADIMIVRGNSSPAVPVVDWDTKAPFFSNPGRIRIPKDSGQWYTFTWSTGGSYPLSAANEVLQLTTPFVQQPSDPLYAYPASMTGWLPSSGFSSCDIQLGNDVLPFHQPISLPSGVVIDLNYSSTNVQALAGIGGTTTPYADIMFSPRGGVSGYLSAQGPLHFLLRDVQDASSGVNPFAVGAPGTANQDQSKGDRLIVSLFPQTGLVQTFEMDATDNSNNQTGQPGPDGLADNPFNFAQQGQSAGR